MYNTKQAVKHDIITLSISNHVKNNQTTEIKNYDMTWRSNVVSVFVWYWMIDKAICFVWRLNIIVCVLFSGEQ